MSNTSSKLLQKYAKTYAKHSKNNSNISTSMCVRLYLKSVCKKF